MQRIEMSNIVDSEIYCPFCGKKVWDEEEQGVCEHILFRATDYGFDFIRSNLGWDGDYEEQDELSLDEFTDAIKYSNAIKFATYQPAPSFFGVYVAFALNIVGL